MGTIRLTTASLIHSLATATVATMKIVLMLVCSLLYFASSLPLNQNEGSDGSNDSQTTNDTTAVTMSTARDKRATGSTNGTTNSTTTVADVDGTTEHTTDGAPKEITTEIVYVIMDEDPFMYYYYSLF